MKKAKSPNMASRLARLVLAAALLGLAADAHALFGLGSKSDDRIAAAARRASELAREAELVWGVNHDAERAVALYQQAIDVCLEAEEANPKGDLGSVRFQRAFCETQIDRVKFDAATSNQRTVAVMTRPEQPPAASPPVVAAAASRQPPATAQPPPASPRPADMPEKATPVAAAAPRLSASDVAEEIEWARDMIENNGHQEARDALMKALRTAPDNYDARILLAALECKEGQYQEALLVLEDLEKKSTDPTLHLLRAGAFLGNGEAYQAMLELDKLLEKYPTNPDALMNMAYLTMELSGKTSEAAMYYRQAIKHGAPPDAALARRLGL